MKITDVRTRVATVTGTALGIGRTTAEVLAEEGAKVVVADIDASGGEAARRDGTAVAAACDRRHGVRHLGTAVE